MTNSINEIVEALEWVVDGYKKIIELSDKPTNDDFTRGMVLAAKLHLDKAKAALAKLEGAEVYEGFTHLSVNPIIEKTRITPFSEIYEFSDGVTVDRLTSDDKHITIAVFKDLIPEGVEGE